MEKNKIVKKLNELINSYLCQNPPAGIDFTLKLRDHLGFDSLRQIELLMEVEAVFNVEIDDYESAQIITVYDIVYLINKKLNKEELV